jgi:hypothetical protein
MDKISGLLILMLIFLVGITLVIRGSPSIIHFTNKQLLKEDLNI